MSQLPDSTKVTAQIRGRSAEFEEMLARVVEAKKNKTGQFADDYDWEACAERMAQQAAEMAESDD